MLKIFTTALTPAMFGEAAPLDLFKLGELLNATIEKVGEEDVKLWIEQRIAVWYLDDVKLARHLEQHFRSAIASMPTEFLKWPSEAIVHGVQSESADLILVAEGETGFGFWEVRCANYTPQTPVVCGCGGQATHYDQEHGYLCEECFVLESLTTLPPGVSVGQR